MSKYKENFLNYASKLDAVTNSKSEIIKYGISIVEENDKEAIILLLKKISRIIDSKEYSREIKEIANFLKKSLVEYLGYLEIKRICSQDEEKKDTRNLKELLKELNNLIGLKNVKSKVNDLIVYQKVQKMRRDMGLNIVKGTLHLSFIGNPGTGKTTVARIIGRIYKQLGLLSKGHFIEVSRTNLIAGYQGQTALKVKKVIEKAKGGVLFIDEAYSITENEQTDSYGRECITELTKALEDYRDDLVVIVAGYPELMEQFFSSNPGLKSRFNTFIEFEDYTKEELLDILIMMCENSDYRLSNELKEKLTDFFEEKLQDKSENFPNGRMVRNIYDDLVMNHARRIVSIENITKEDLSIITDSDFKRYQR